MKVAILGSFPPLRGISSYCFELARSLAKATCQVEFISFRQMYPNFLYPGRDSSDDHTFPDFHSPNLTVKRNIAWYNPIGWIMEALACKASILHAQWWSLPLAPIFFCMCVFFKFRRKPIVFTIHNVLPHERSPVYLAISKLLFSFSDHFIVHSKLNKQQLIKHYGTDPSKISLIPHGPLNLLVNANSAPEVIRTELGLKRGDKVILLFGAIRPYKGVETSIRAFAQVAKKIPDARLMIVGKPWQCWMPYEEMILQYGIKNKVVTRLGYIPSGEVYRYFMACDLVILPYHHFDSQSGVGGTAISFRKPMIVTQTGGLPDLVLDSRAIIPPNDPVALANSIIRCLEEPGLLMKLSQDAEIIAERLSWEGIAKKTIQVYEELLR
jgi:glycosyltransferase involved in cell wall biosynthesis